ncbi:3-isopropylmalate dehydratase small subunit [bacterium]|nr:3-isopropylmalate dehydratase small subunit [bacterium]
MKFQGKTYKFGDNVNTDEIIPARYLNTSDPQELAAHVMEDADPVFSGLVKPGDIVVAGRNFGCGSSREHAPLALKTAGIACIVAVSFARIFYRNAFNIGLPILECPDAASETQAGQEIAIDAGQGIITNLITGKTYQVAPIPPFMQELVELGGLMEYVKKNLAA